MNLMQYQAILFDLDGTLIETIKLYEEACIEAFALTKIKMSKAEFQYLYAKGWRLPEWLTHYDMDTTHETAIRKKRDEIYEELLRTRAIWRDGAEDILAYAKKKSPTGIVTGSWRRYLKAINKRIHFDRYIDAVITADDMHDKMKPDPYGLLLMAKKLGVKPQECIYIGDQAFDIEAAEAAGMTSCLVQHDYTPLNAHLKAHHIVQDLEKLTKII